MIIRKTRMIGYGDLDHESRVVKEFMQGAHGLPMRERLWTPKCDIYETPDTLSVCLEIPGVDEDDVQIAFDAENGILAVAGRRKKPACAQRKRVHLMEMPFGPFEKMLRMSVEIAEGGVDASLRNGVLHISMKKAR